MIRKGMFLGVMAAFAMAFSLAAAGPARAQNSCTTTTTDLSGLTLTNPCNGEVVTITSGTETVTFCLNDAKHASVRDDIHATGAGDQGNTYVINAHENAQETANAQGLFEFNLNLQENFISQGSAPNFLAHCSEHLTITPSGQVNFSPLDCTTSCNG